MLRCPSRHFVDFLSTGASFRIGEPNGPSGNSSGTTISFMFSSLDNGSKWSNSSVCSNTAHFSSRRRSRSSSPASYTTRFSLLIKNHSFYELVYEKRNDLYV